MQLLLPNLSRSALRCKISAFLPSPLCSMPCSLQSACSGPTSLRKAWLMRQTSELLEQRNNCIPPFLKPTRMFAKTQTAWGGVRKRTKEGMLFIAQKHCRDFILVCLFGLRREFSPSQGNADSLQAIIQRDSLLHVWPQASGGPRKKTNDERMAEIISHLV